VLNCLRAVIFYLALRFLRLLNNCTEERKYDKKIQKYEKKVTSLEKQADGKASGGKRKLKVVDDDTFDVGTDFLSCLRPSVLLFAGFSASFSIFEFVFSASSIDI
jgi:hypothetical protein